MIAEWIAQDCPLCAPTNEIEKKTNLHAIFSFVHGHLFCSQQGYLNHIFPGWLYSWNVIELIHDRYSEIFKTKLSDCNWVVTPGFLEGGLWCSTIFQLYRGSQFYWWRKPEKTIDLGQVTDKLVLSPPRLSWIRTQNGRGDMHWLHK